MERCVCWQAVWTYTDTCSSFARCTITYWEQTAWPRSVNFYTHTRWQGTFADLFHPNRHGPWPSFSRSKIQIEFIGKLALKRQQIWQTLLLQQIESLIWPFDRHIYIWPWAILKVKSKVMHNILLENISQIVTDRINITITNTESHMLPFEWYI